MKQIYFVALCVLITSLRAVAQVPITYYDFELNSNRTTLETTVEQAVNSGSAVTKVGGVTTITGNSGAGYSNGGSAAGKCISATDWSTSTTDPGVAATKYFQFTTSTAGFSGIKLAMEGQATAGKPTKIGVLYSTNGTTFYTDASAPIDLATSWEALTYFELPAAANNASSLTIRIYAYGATSSSQRLDLDNIVVMATQQTSGVKTLLNYPAFGTSLTSGTAMNYPWTDFAVSNSGTVCTLQSDLNIAGTFSVGSGAALDCNTYTLDGGTDYGLGAGTFTLSAGGILQTASPLGITPAGTASGSIQTGTRNFSADADYTYDGTVNQVTGLGLPNNLTGTLTINNTGTTYKTVTLSALRTIASGGSLILQSGTFAAGTYLTLASGSTLNRDNGTITGVFTNNALVRYTGNSKTVSIELGSLTTGLNVAMTTGQTLTFASSAVVPGAVTLTSGTLDLGANSLTFTGNIVRNGTTQTGTIDADNGTLIFTGVSSQNVPANSFTGAVKNITVNNVSGVVLNSNTTISSALTLTAGYLSLNGTTLTLGGTITGTGKLRGSTTSGLAITSTVAAGTVSFDQTTDGTTNALSSLSVTGTGSAILGSKLYLQTLLNVAAGTLNLNAQNVVLRSLSTNTARVAPVTGTISGATNVTVERQIPNDGRRYRLITPGVTTTTSIKANWMEGANNTAIGTNVNPKPGYGTQITGSGGSANGFDATQTNATSLYTYNQTTGAWVSVTSANGTLDAAKGYLLFVRGDRSVDLTAPGAPATLAGTSTTLRATGSLQTGTQTTAALANAGSFSLVSNPFASPVSWSSIYTNNSSKFDNFYTYWDPNVGSRGAFVTVTNTGIKSNPAANATVEIQGGQAYFVRTKTGVTAPTLAQREADKSTTTNLDVFRAGTQLEQLGISLYYTDANGTRINADGVNAVYGNSFATEVNEDDATQIGSWDEDVAIVREGKSLSIETKPLIDDKDTTFLAIARLKVQDYQWQFEPSQFASSGLMAYLVDNFTGSQSLISLSSTTVIPFTVTADAASSAANRFYVIYRASGGVLPVTFTGVKAYQQGSSNKIEWKTTNEQSITAYEVERSTDGQTFNRIATVGARGSAANSYSAIDATPAATTYYRVKGTEASGASKYTSIVTVKSGGKDVEVSVYPNPVVGNSINLQFANLPKGKYIVALFNTAGQNVMTANFEHVGGSSTEEVIIDKSIAKGIYQMRVSGEGRQWVMQVIR